MTLDYRAVVQREIALFVGASRTDLTAQVVHCPEWTVADLTWHMCGVLRFWRAIGTGEITSPADEARVDYERVADDQLASLLEHEADAITRTVYDIDPAKPVWTWSAQKNVGFIQRRMAQESAVHRWDAELAVGAPNPIDADLAVDGIDEFLTLFLPAEEESLAGAIDVVRLEPTDRDAGWTVTVGDGRCDVGDGDADVVAGPMPKRCCSCCGRGANRVPYRSKATHPCSVGSLRARTSVELGRRRVPAALRRAGGDGRRRARRSRLRHVVAAAFGARRGMWKRSRGA